MATISDLTLQTKAAEQKAQAAQEAAEKASKQAKAVENEAKLLNAFYNTLGQVLVKDGQITYNTAKNVYNYKIAGDKPLLNKTIMLSPALLTAIVGSGVSVTHQAVETTKGITKATLKTADIPYSFATPVLKEALSVTNEILEGLLGKGNFPLIGALISALTAVIQGPEAAVKFMQDYDNGKLTKASSKGGSTAKSHLSEMNDKLNEISKAEHEANKNAGDENLNQTADRGGTRPGI